MTAQRISPSGRIANNLVYGVYGSLGAPTAEPGVGFKLGISNITPDDSPIRLNFSDRTVSLPKGKYLAILFGRFSNEGTDQTVYSIVVGGLNIWSWASAPGSDNVWLEKSKYFEVSVDGTLAGFEFGNTGADADPSVFSLGYQFIRLGD